MAKLQLYVSRATRGFSNLLAVNPTDEISRIVGDFSDALESLDYDKAVAHTFYLLTYLENGIIATIIRTVAGQRQNDHYAASVFIPAGTALLPADIDEIRSVLETILSETDGDLTPDAIAALRALFATDYPVTDNRQERLPSHGKVYAFAYFGDNAPSLRQYTDARFYLPQLASYAGVILIDRTSGARGRREALDVTRHKLPATTLLAAPKPVSGFAPYIFGHPFKRDLTVAVGEPIDIQWRRSGFDTVTQTVVPEAGKICTVEAPDMSEAVKTLTPSSFYVTEQGIKHQLFDAEIKVNGQTIDKPQRFTLKDLTAAKVEVKVKGYFPFSATLDLAATSQALISLKQLHRTYRFDLPLLTPEASESVRIYLNTKKPVTDSPIEGYVVAGGEVLEGTGVNNTLVYVGSHSRRMIYVCIAAAVAALIVGFALGWVCKPATHKSKKQSTEQLIFTDDIVTDSTVSEVEKVPGTVTTVAVTEDGPADYSTAVAYLDDNKTWRRDEMEAIPALRGLYDDMNTYNFAAITDKWAPLLDASRNFQAVVRAVRGSATKRAPATGDHAPAYINSGEQAIGWRSYTFWVDP